MSYIDVDDDNIIEDLSMRKEFLSLMTSHKYEPEENIIPYFMLKHEMSKGKYLRLRSYQMFTRNFINPHTPYSRLLVKHGMGTGKTASAISIAMEFIKYFKLNLKQDRPNFVYVIGFTRAQFERDLFGFTEFGFITKSEQDQYAKLRQYAQLGAESDIASYKEFQCKLRRRLGNMKGNGYFRFVGYRELANRVFISNTSITNMNEADIYKGIKDGSLVIDVEYVSRFANSLIICDEVHNIYNSLAKNNWGVAIQIILNTHNDAVRAVFLSGTVLKNSQTEIVDVLNLLIGTSEKSYTKSDFFDSENELLPDALDRISILTRGRVSFLVDTNPSRYPSHSYVGESIKGAKYIKFVRCKMPKLQNDTYIKEQNNKMSLHEHSYIFDMVFPNPLDESVGLFKSSQLRMIETASSAWRNKHKVLVIKKTRTIGGSILSYDKIKQYSSKFPKMLSIIFDIMESGGGKVFIYHKFVHMTGVHMIGNILSANGIIAINEPTGSETRCALCKLKKNEHKENDIHKFTPARFVIIHGEIDKRTIVRYLDMFNDKDNTDGGKIMIIIGSRVMREAYDLAAVRHVFVMSRPDNIPSMLQISARTIRAGSHKLLPPDKHNVKIYIFTSSTTDGKLTYEEDRYIQKINDYIIIQRIERAIHVNAVDSIINRAVIEPALVNDDIGHLYFDQNIKVKDHLRLEDMNLSTFNIYYKEYEVVDIIYIIKRLFMEFSKVWSFDDMWKAVQAPPFDIEYNTSVFDRENFLIALERLVWVDDYFFDIEDGNVNILDILFDASDKRIIINGENVGVIVQMGEYYIVFPINSITKKPDIYIDSPFRISESDHARIIDISKYTKSALSQNRFADLKISFINLYKSKTISEMTDAICVHGPDFHIMLIEEIISYIFDLWTNPKTVASSEYNTFYFQMIYYYDVMGLVVWMNSARSVIKEIYGDFSNLIKVNKQSSGEVLIPKGYSEKNRGDLIHIARSIERSGCSWCPNTTKTRYDLAISKSKLRFAKMKTSNIDATDDMIPIGHFIDDIPRFYHPSRGWFSSPEYTQATSEWKENNIIVGFDVRSSGGLHIRFRLRNPRHKIKHQKDARLAERGIICTSRSKPFLHDLMKKLNIKETYKANITVMCGEIRARLMYLELVERAKGSNIKWFYNHYEPGGAELI